MINGMMLLKICDPDYSSPALNDFSMGFALMSIISIFTSPIFYSLLANGSTLANFLWACATGAGYTLMFVIGRKMLMKQNPENYEFHAYHSGG
jgi:ESS family glutamate:Na+ symporter